MIIDKPKDVLPGATFKNTPHQNDRPDNAEVSLLVIHNISLPEGQFGGEYVDQFFMGTLDCENPTFDYLKGVRVSSHLYIDRKGRITQYVPFSKRAWHAGASVFQGTSDCNNFSIGIEVEGTDKEPYTPKQYEVLAEVARQLMHNFPAITRERIVGHSAIAPGRKTDPGESFDWKHFFELL